MEKIEEEFSEEETEKRFAAALRGARIAGHKPMEAVKKAAAKPLKVKAKKKPGK